MRARERRNNARIQTAAQVGANRNIGPQVQPHRFVKQRTQLLFKVFRGVLQIEVIVNLPITARTHHAVTDLQHMPRWQFVYAFEERLARKTELERQVFFERLKIRFNVFDEWEQRFYFRSEVKSVADNGVVERFNAETITGAKEPPLLLVPQ